MTTYEAGAAAVDILLASAAIALVVCAAWLLVRSRHASTIRLFGRTVHHPRLWAAGAVCAGFSVLLGLGDLTEVLPSDWRTPSRRVGAVLLLTAYSLMVIRWLLGNRAMRRQHGREQQVGP